MNYIGSKFRLLDFLANHIKSNKKLKDCIFCDLFSGTAAVGKFFKTKVKQIIANDKEYYSFVLNKNYIFNRSFLDSADLIDELNCDELTPPIEGKFIIIIAWLRKNLKI